MKPELIAVTAAATFGAGRLRAGAVRFLFLGLGFFHGFGNADGRRQQPPENDNANDDRYAHRSNPFGHGEGMATDFLRVGQGEGQGIGSVRGRWGGQV